MFRCGEPRIVKTTIISQERKFVDNGHGHGLCNKFMSEFHILKLPGFVMIVIVFAFVLIMARNIAENKQTVYYVQLTITSVRTGTMY